MKLYSFLIYNLQKDLVYSYFNLNDIFFFYRPKVKNLILDLSLNMLNMLDHYTLYNVREDLNGHIIKIFCHLDHNYYIVISDEDFEDRILYQLILDTKKRNIDKSLLNLLCKNYNDHPEKQDKIKNIQDDLEETKIIMLNSIDKLLERGEKLDEILERTHELNQISEQFNNRSKKINSCCVLI